MRKPYFNNILVLLLACFSCSCDKTGIRNPPSADTPKGDGFPNDTRSANAPQRGVPHDAVPAGSDVSLHSVLTGGPGSERTLSLEERMKVMSVEGWTHLLVNDAKALLHEDVFLLSKYQDSIAKVSPEALIAAIEASSLPKADDVLLYILQKKLINEKTDAAKASKFASMLGIKEQRIELLQKTMTSAMERDPKSVIGNVTQIFQSVDPKVKLPRDEQPGQTEGSALIWKIAQATASKSKQQAWDSMMTVQDRSLRNTLATGIFQGQLSRNSITATEWLDTLPAGPEKSGPIRVLVAHLYAFGDAAAAEAWTKSAENYLTPVDFQNIELFRSDYERRSAQ